MGADFYCYAVQGVEVNIKKFFVTKTIKAFDHDYSKDFQFCPKTGRPLWKEITVTNPKLNVGENWDTDCGLGPFKFYHNTDGRTYVLGQGIEAGGYKGEENMMHFVEDVNKLKQDLKTLLKPIEAWDEMSFGIHLLQYCSY